MNGNNVMDHLRSNEDIGIIKGTRSTTEVTGRQNPSPTMIEEG
jgi:hypothetical protein